MKRDDLDVALKRLLEQLSNDGVACSAVLYGSAVRGDWVPGRSDVNLMLVLADPTPGGMKRLTSAVTTWHQAGFTPPLIIGEAEWQRAVDVFPIEITDMRSAYRVVAGRDPLEGLVVRPADLRRALESELRGKLLRLRQAYVRFGETPVTLGGFAVASASPLLVLLRTTAVLLGRQPGTTPADTVASLAAELGESVAGVQEVFAHRRDAEWGCPPETFVRYLEAVRSAVDLVDHYSHGDS